MLKPGLHSLAYTIQLVDNIVHQRHTTKVNDFVNMLMQSLDNTVAATQQSG